MNESDEKNIGFDLTTSVLKEQEFQLKNQIYCEKTFSVITRNSQKFSIMFFVF